MEFSSQKRSKKSPIGIRRLMAPASLSAGINVTVYPWVLRSYQKVFRRDFRPI